MKTIVDIILSYDNIPPNAKHTAYRVAYFQIMKDVARLLSKDFLSSKENEAMVSILNSKRKGEHYSTFVRRVFSLANTAKSMRAEVDNTHTA